MEGIADVDDIQSAEFIRHVGEGAGDLDRRLDALSLLVGQDTHAFWERLLLPFCYQQFFVGVPGGEVNDQRRDALLANGQYLLVRRDAYDRIGGHETVRSSIAEDVRLAHLLRAYHLRYGVARGEHLVFARLYHRLSDLWTGFARNSFQFMTLDSRRGLAVLASAAVAALTPTLVAVGLRSGLDTILLISAYSYAFLVLGVLAWEWGWSLDRIAEAVAEEFHGHGPLSVSVAPSTVAHSADGSGPLAASRFDTGHIVRWCFVH